MQKVPEQLKIPSRLKKPNGQEQLVHCIVLSHCLCILESNEDSQSPSKVLVMLKLKNIEAMADRSEPRTLIIGAKKKVPLILMTSSDLKPKLN